VAQQEEDAMNGAELVAELKRKHSISTDRALAKHLGMTEIALGGWKRSKTPLTARQVANAIEKASRVAVTKSQRATLRPIVEFFPIDAVESARGVKYELFPTGKDDNPLHGQLRAALSKASGIYVFYDSRGRAIYAGKAKEQSLWHEMKDAFNRDRDTQKVYRVAHPSRRQAFKPAYAKPRQPTSTELKLNDLAAYVSVYEVEKAMINDLEALLVRGFANDLLNKRMEKFGTSGGTKKASTKKSTV
jgi:DNA-binding transcriptional regulator YdaS (Cro superfamily)